MTAMHTSVARPGRRRHFDPDDASGSVEELAQYATTRLPPHSYASNSADDIQGFVQGDFDNYARRMRKRHSRKIEAMQEENKQVLRAARVRLHDMEPEDTGSPDGSTSREPLTEAELCEQAAVTIQCAWRCYQARCVYTDLLFEQYDAEYTSQRQLDIARADECNDLTNIARMELEQIVQTDKRLMYEFHRNRAARSIQGWWQRLSPYALRQRVAFLRQQIDVTNGQLMQELDRREVLQAEIADKQDTLAAMLQNLAGPAPSPVKKRGLMARLGKNR